MNTGNKQTKTKEKEKDNLNMAQLQINNNTSNTNYNTTNTNSSKISPDQSKTSTKKAFSKANTISNENKPTNAEFMKLTEKVEVAGKVPSARFGHSMVLVSATKSVLFGGAVGDTRNFSITNDCFSFNVLTKIWIKLEFKNNTNVPCARAAHAACSNENLEMFIYGGSILGGALANDDLYYFDIKNGEEQATWNIVDVKGTTPGKRYGHTMAYVHPNLVVFGGNTGTLPINDVWIISVSELNTKKDMEWIKLTISEDSIPLPRVYHSAAVCTKGNAKGMMLIFGGRDGYDNALNDTWGLRKHRDGKWDWAQAPSYKSDFFPKHRFNHYIVFVGTLMIITGGRSKNIQDILPTEIYDTETSEWNRFNGIGLFRHMVFRKDSYLFIYGGFENKNPNSPIERIFKVDLLTYLKQNLQIHKKLEIYLSSLKEKDLKSNKETSNKELSNISQSAIVKNNDKIENKENKDKSNNKLVNKDVLEIEKSIIKIEDRKFRLASKAVVLKFNENMEEDFGLISKIEIEKLNDEGKRLGFVNLGSLNVNQVNRIFNENLINKFVDVLFHPFDWYTEEVEKIHNKLPFSLDQIDILISEATKVISKEPTLVRIKSPSKVFGNIFGQYNDLMRFFESFGHPTDDNAMGDVHLFHYVFLGDYVDRGNYSLEVILLLLALKVKYPENIILTRGHHEDIAVNRDLGLAEDCEKRLNDNIKLDSSIFKKLNNVFELFPLAVLIDNRILCVHGGIGTSISKLSDISNIKRPIQVIQDIQTLEQQIVIDLLWSEYSEDIDEVEINEDRDIKKTGSILKYGKERLNRFIQDNNLMMVISSHQFINEGVKSFSNNKLLVVYSVTNFMDKYNNMGGMISINKNSTQITPKLIDVNKTDKKNYKVSNINKVQSPVRNFNK